ncbi:MAG TPA: YdeI/OmpD-associated family protein [Thermoanaerobaculia bacterium]|nr:YdeI/OmpD-associated family protein [Thermoanaerobaculia bacterium]
MSELGAMKTLHVTTREEWRAWLAAHHATEREIWLVYAKQHTGQPRVSYDHAVEEALCFGWIDSIVRRLDDDLYAQKFTPRINTAKWSESNLRRFAALVKEERMTPAGLAKGPSPDAVPVKPPRRTADEGDEIPDYIQRRLQTNATAWRFFQSLAPSYRRLYVKWIDTAKREETRRKRLEEAIGLLEEGKKLGLK